MKKENPNHILFSLDGGTHLIEHQARITNFEGDIHLEVIHPATPDFWRRLRCAIVYLFRNCPICATTFYISPEQAFSMSASLSKASGFGPSTE